LHSEYLLVVALGDETGRLLRYDPRTRRVAVLHDSLSYPNGVAVAADGSHVVVSHTALEELRRYWVRGPRAGENETLAELPGYPDNVRSDGRGGYWVALSHGADDAVGGAVPTLAVRVNGRGGAVEEALDGLSFATVSEVGERNGTLWVGSVDTPYAGELRPR
jgi:sugar lactone lactonase YvrE